MDNLSQVESIFFAALEKGSAAERAAYLDEACRNDPELRREVERLLAAHPKVGAFMASPPTATLDSPPRTEGPGSVIGPYKLLQQIGEGGMGTVYMAEQQEPVRRMVALKVIKAGVDTAQVVARFEAERQALALMDHPNIARILDAGATENGKPYVVMELVKGIPITKYCDERKLTPRERLELFIPVCQAVQHAHQKGIIHRDLKPSNVLIALYDGKPVPKVIDFGVAKAMGQKLTERTLFTGFGALVGTLEYMSPEQAELNQLDIDTRSDIYSLGVLLYELLTGTTPLDRKHLKEGAILEVLRRIREEEPPKPSTRLSSSDALPTLSTQRSTEPGKLAGLMRGELDWIVMKALDKDRNRRYETANAVVQDIQRYLTDEPVLAGPPSAGYRLRKFVKRNRGTVTAAAIVLTTLLAGIAGTSLGWIEALWQRDDAVQARKDESDALTLAEKRRREAEKVAHANKLLATKEAKARLEAEQRREEAETLALRIHFEHYLAKAEERPDLALVGMASLLPKAARLKDQALANSLRLHVGALSEHAARLSLMFSRARFNSVVLGPGDKVPERRWYETLEHEAGVFQVALSADGKTALASTWDKTARLWDTATGKQIGPTLQHQTWVFHVALSADGKTALTGSDDKTARLWDLATGKPIGPPLQHQDYVLAMALSADGKTALTLCRDRSAWLWDTAGGKPIGPLLRHQYGVLAMALSADGKTALTTNYARTARLFDGATGKPIGPALQHQDQILAVALSADGKIALTGDGDVFHTKGEARLWDVATGKPIGPPLQHKGSVVAVALSADGKMALTGSEDMTARLWETATGKPVGPPLQHQGWVRAVALSADGKTALTGSRDNTARLWETATGKPIGPPLQHPFEVFAVALSADAKTALTRSSDKTAVWLRGATTGKPIGLALQHNAPVFAVALSADGKTALTGSDDKTARLWETATGKPIGPPLQHQRFVRGVALSVDGKTALTGSDDKTARLWETATGKPIGLPLLHQGPVLAVALSPDGKMALTGSEDKTARLWETATGKPIGPPLQHQSRVQSVVLSVDGKTALTGSADKTARLWETATGKTIGPPLLHQGQVWSLALSADGKTALTGSQENSSHLWETATGKPIGPPLQHQSFVSQVALSADGKTALTGSLDNTARFWETATGKPIGPPLLHQGSVVTVAVSADGKTALTGSSDKTARLWEKATGKPIGPPLPHQGRVVAVALSADGTTALTGSDDNTARVWKVPQPMRGDPERIMLWAQVITGLEVDELTAVHVLDAATWQQRRERLQQLGGPPTQP